MIKILILLLIVIMMVALASGLHALFKGDPKRLSKLLWLRVGIAVGLIALLIWGASTGQLAMQAPWSGLY